MPNSYLATVIPVYSKALSAREVIRLDLTISNSRESETFFIGPSSLDWSFYKNRWPGVRIELFEPKHFQSVASYSDWLLSPELYEKFSSHEFILVAQTDSFLLRPLPKGPWDFDYLGAVWDPPLRVFWDRLRRKLVINWWLGVGKPLVVGNGGLSLRRTEALANFTRLLPSFANPQNEDVVISFFAQRHGLAVASERMARQFFMESEAARWTPKIKIPDVMGFHALETYNERLENQLLFSRSASEDPALST